MKSPLVGLGDDGGINPRNVSVHRAWQRLEQAV